MRVEEILKIKESHEQIKSNVYSLYGDVRAARMYVQELSLTNNDPTLDELLFNLIRLEKYLDIK